MGRRALLVAIDQYDHMVALGGCVADALALEPLIAFHQNGTANYTCKRLYSDEIRVSRRVLLEACEELFAYDDEVLLYFSGHGVSIGGAVFLASQDGTATVPGIAMRDLLQMANASRAREILLIFDCCHAGAFGDPLLLETELGMLFQEGITLLAAARSDQPAVEVTGQGMFTRLIISALDGTAKDVRGRVSSAAIYGFVEQALGPWEQRPIYKSNARRLAPVRYCEPDVSVEELQRLPELFPTPDALYPLDPTYEHSFREAIAEHVAIFQIFKRYRNARLLKTTLDPDLFYAAKHRTDVQLTPLGQYYWQLAAQHLLDGDQLPPPSRRRPMPDAEAVARLFHETYERLAPSFEYRTRKATAKPWKDVPERNKQLMIATAAEVLTMLFPPEDLVSPQATRDTDADGPLPDSRSDTE